LLSKNRSSLRRQWLRHSLADPNLKKLKIAAQKRAEPILPVIDEAMKAMTLSLEEMARAPMKAAEQHGRVRHNQGLAPTALVEEYNLLRRCIFAVAQEHHRHMEPHLLLHDLARFGEALDLQLQRALGKYFDA